jgi:hypothetical protein
MTREKNLALEKQRQDMLYEKTKELDILKVSSFCPCNIRFDMTQIPYKAFLPMIITHILLTVVVSITQH